MRPESRGSGRDLVSRGNAIDYLAAVANRGWYRARAYARPLVRWQVPVASITGTVAGTGQEQTVVVAGWKRTVAYYVDRFFTSMREPVPLASVPVLRLPAVLKSLRGDCDLIMARVPRPGSEQLFGDCYLHVPEAVEARLDIPDDPSDLALASTRARRNIARVRDNGLTWTVSTNDADFQVFYDDFYLPFLRARYGELAHEVARPVLLKAYRRGCLLWVLKDGQRVAGALFQPSGPVLRWIVMGAPADSEDVARIGALSAIYLFGAECAAQHGFRWLDLGFSKSSPRDGVLSHKASWGARVYCPWRVDHDLLFSWRVLNEGIAEFLSTTPLIVREGSGLSAVTAVAPEQRAKGTDPHAIGRKTVIRGLRHVYVLGAAGGGVASSPGRVGTAVIAMPDCSSAEFRHMSRRAPEAQLPATSDAQATHVDRVVQTGHGS